MNVPLTRCLIVDDHAQLRNLLSNWLESIFPDVYFLSASSGESALQLVESHQPQVVVMDLHLTGMSGIEATRKIKQDFPDTLVIIHTIHDEQAFRLDALAAGADAFVIKSQTVSDLIPLLTNLFPHANLQSQQPVNNKGNGNGKRG